MAFQDCTSKGKLKRICLIITLWLISQFSVVAQNSDIYDLFTKFASLYNSGDLLGAEKCMLLVLDSKESISTDYLVAAYNNLGAANTLLGKYKDALEYYDLAESSITDKEEFRKSLADIYINKALICNYQKSYAQAIDYLEEGIRMYFIPGPGDKDLYQRISTAYLNIGIAYYHLQDYQSALRYLEKSAELKSRFNLPRIAIVYQNIARVYVKKGDFLQAEKFFRKGIESFNSEFGENYFRIADLYMDYGRFLSSENKTHEARYIFNKSLAICLKYYGEKSPTTALSYKYLGDYFMNLNKCDSSLIFYQKALISLEDNFNDPEPGSNPMMESSVYDIRLLDILKAKAKAFMCRSIYSEDPEIKLTHMRRGLESIMLSLRLISKIRADYLDEESRIYLADNEKETYISAVEISSHMYTLTGDPKFIGKMYDIVRQAKAAILQEEIKDNELLYSGLMPDSVRIKHNDIRLNIGALNNLIREEKLNPHPDKGMIDLWSNNLFEYKREYEKLEITINKEFPESRNLIRKTGPLSLEEIQSKITKDETLVEYFLSNKYDTGRRKLYIFAVTGNALNFVETRVDSIFKNDIETIRRGTVQWVQNQDTAENFREFTSSLFNMYSLLIQPVEKFFTGNRIKIIPDEEIAFLPFSAFLAEHPDSDQNNYEGLQYLIFDYIFSYGYTSSLIFPEPTYRKKTIRIDAFSPDYTGSQGTKAVNLSILAGAEKEIRSISQWFPCREYLGGYATESNFKLAIQQPSILHLAMHSVEDTVNSNYSCLLFDREAGAPDDGKLYNYEISLYRIRSPMVVLSACNTGTGTLYKGEGIMSLARGFILAGSASVVMTFWSVNDEASAAVMTDFYHNLSKGMDKAESLRSAQLKYMKSMPPLYSDPFYWAGYEILGDSDAIVRNAGNYTMAVILSLILAAGASLIYFRIRSNLSASS